ncbi:hypothetical protein B0H17DRAFT_1190584 [Mycena rosella]|uniref:Uncharacterized protein n=1 Tax=Mycena rosella TaxID=1033263 RepID=A0AAD7H3F0_MYCRO|nr:hypothetical protein B0H17DRAFT_1190584 [Mycena rosella]
MKNQKNTGACPKASTQVQVGSSTQTSNPVVAVSALSPAPLRPPGKSTTEQWRLTTLPSSTDVSLLNPIVSIGANSTVSSLPGRATGNSNHTTETTDTGSTGAKNLSGRSYKAATTRNAPSVERGRRSDAPYWRASKDIPRIISVVDEDDPNFVKSPPHKTVSLPNEDSLSEGTRAERRAGKQRRNRTDSVESAELREAAKGSIDDHIAEIDEARTDVRPNVWDDANLAAAAAAIARERGANENLVDFRDDKLRYSATRRYCAINASMRTRNWLLSYWQPTSM